MNRIFGMGTGKDLEVGIWEFQRNTCWVQQPHSGTDMFLAHSGMLIHGTGGEVHILHLEGKDPQDAPYGWDHKVPIPPPFYVERTMGVGISDSLCFLGGERNPHEGLRQDLHSGNWMDLPKMIQGRENAASVMLDPHTILVLSTSPQINLSSTFILLSNNLTHAITLRQQLVTMKNYCMFINRKEGIEGKGELLPHCEQPSH